MKKYIFILIFSFGIIFSTFSNDTISSKIIIYRENNFYGSGISYKIYANDTLITGLKNNSYFVYDCNPGEYNFIINKIKSSRFSLKVEEGKTYYLRFVVNMGFWNSIPELILVDSAMAQDRINKGDFRQSIKSKIPYFRLPNRIGLNFALGGGFDEFPMFKTTNGDESSISFGGGYAIGLKYGYEISKHLDLAFAVNYQFSTLQPYLKNATTTFQRGYISITPSFIIPVSGGERKRFKLGAGYDYYWDAHLIIDGNKILQGLNDTWQYNAASGYHISMLFEMNFGEKWSMNYGMKYYKVNYEFKSGGILYPISAKLKSPDGSGLDFLFGVFYSF